MSLRTDRILRLADRIDGLPYAEICDPEYAEERYASCQDHLDPAFNMAVYSFRCHTPACIAGHAMVMADEEGYKGIREGCKGNKAGIGLATHVGIYLGLVSDVKDFGFPLGDLFDPVQTYSFGAAMPDDLGFISSKRAAAVLRHLADEEEVRWDLFDNDGKRVEGEPV